MKDTAWMVMVQVMVQLIEVDVLDQALPAVVQVVSMREDVERDVNL